MREPTPRALLFTLLALLGLAALVGRLFSSAKRPAVFDADALNALSSAPAPLAARKRERDDVLPRILTPHPGEFARLSNTETATVQKNREALAVKFAAEHRLVLVLKVAVSPPVPAPKRPESRRGRSGGTGAGSPGRKV